jgi:Uma2 family endonuclease
MTTANPIAPPLQPLPPPAARLTADEFGRRHAGEHVEFINGTVKEIAMPGGKHGKVCNWVAFHLTRHVAANNLGHVFSNDTFVKVPTRDDPERVYGADVCFVSYDRLPKDAEIPEGVLPVTPNLVVEVRSPSDTWTQAIGKVVDYLKAGIPVVVFIDPNTKTASVCVEPFGQQMFGPEDTLTIPEVLPGLAVPVAKFFE